jgi:hypothetical protein
MKKYICCFIMLSLVSCQVTETIQLNENGSGKIQVEYRRNENSYMQVAKENYAKEDQFVDTTYVFKDYISKYSETFLKFTRDEQKLFKKYENVTTHIKQSSYEKEYFSLMWQDFNTIEEVPDIYKAGNYASDLKNNYALAAEKHYYGVSYAFDGTIFKRIVKITNPAELKIQQDEIDGKKTWYSKYNLVQTYVLKYRFARMIAKVSNSNAKISEDKKSLELQFLLSDCLKDPESTNLEVVLE